MEEFVNIGVRLDLIVMPWVAVGLLVPGIVLMILAATVWRDRYLDMWHGSGAVGIMLTVFGAISAAIWIGLLVPFKPLYHHWYGTTGTVVSVSNVFEGGSGELSSGYLVQLDNAEHPLVFEDPRVLTFEGQSLSAACSVEWVPAGTDRLNCWIAD